ncbi:SWIM zinc finger family protein [Methanocaldococcus indicus]|uniref:SWIM zinc finger family protein n=1 Tax=Methanocaldococcus indicus TaxID=213231 RepID=UPI003C6D7978
MDEIIRKYGYEIYKRGVEYYKEGRVKSVIKFGDKIYGKVIGTHVYDVVVNLKTLESECSCSYGYNCKHGVATLLSYKNNEYIDADKIIDKLKNMEKEELVKYIIERIKYHHPEFAFNFIGLLNRECQVKLLLIIDKK